MSDGFLDHPAPAEASTSRGAPVNLRDCVDLMRRAADLIDRVSLADRLDAGSTTVEASGGHLRATAYDLRLFRLGVDAMIRVAAELRDDRGGASQELRAVRRDLNQVTARSVEVATDRWLPGKDSFTFDGDRRMLRRKESGERTHVRYQLVDDGEQWRFRVRLRLSLRLPAATFHMPAPRSNSSHVAEQTSSSLAAVQSINLAAGP